MRLIAGLRSSDFFFLSLLIAASTLFMPHRALAADADTGTIRGKISYKIFDYADGTGIELIKLKPVRGKPVELKLRKRSQRDNLRDGDEISVRGRFLSAGAFRVAAADGSIETVGGPTAAAVSGMRKVAVIRIASSDGSVGCSATDLGALMFSGSGNIRGYYETASFGAVSFALDANADGEPDVFDVTISRATSGACDYSAISNDATSALSARGISLAGFDNKVFVMPSNLNCGWAGLGTLGSGPGTSWIPGQYCGYFDVIAHEIGHNHGFHHASTDANNDGTIDSEYDDRSCIMGYGGVGRRHFNEPHKVQAGWTPSGSIANLPPSGVATILAAERDPFGSSYPQVLRTPRAAGGYYYLSYREAGDAYSANLGGYSGKTSIHHGGTAVGRTYLIATIGDGQSWSAPDGSFTVTQLAHGGGTADLGLNSTCAPVAPTISISPGSASVNQSGTAVNYTVTVSNGDSSLCPATVFSLSSSIPSGFSASFSQSSLSIAPQSSASATMSVSSAVGAADGSYSVQAIVQDGDGVDPAHGNVQASANYTIDTSAPAAPSNLSAIADRKGAVRLSWGASAGAASYRVLRNGSLIATTTGTSYTDRPGSGTHSYAVHALDAAGNLSPAATISVSVSAKGGGKNAR